MRPQPSDFRPQPSDFWRFSKIANETAKKRCPANWRVRRDEFLDALLHDFWSGYFAEAANPPPKVQNWDGRFVYSLSPPNFSPTTRDTVWRSLGHYNKPQTVQDVPEGAETPCELLAGASIEDYGDGARGRLENLCLFETDARAWVEQHCEGLTNADRRKGGQRSYIKPAVEEAVRRIKKELTSEGNCTTLSTVLAWLREKSSEEPFCFEPPILDCDEIRLLDDDTLVFVDHNGNPHERGPRFLERYIREANSMTQE